MDTDSSSNNLYHTVVDNDENKLSNWLTSSEKKASIFFTEYILGQDGVFVLHLISLNIGTQIASKIAYTIWIQYKQVDQQKPETMNKLKNIDQSKLDNFNLIYQQNPPIPVRSKKLELRKRFHGTHENTNSNMGYPNMPTAIASELLKFKARQACAKLNAKCRIKLGSFHGSEELKLHDRDSDARRSNSDNELFGVDNEKFDNLV